MRAYELIKEKEHLLKSESIFFFNVRGKEVELVPI